MVSVSAKKKFHACVPLKNRGKNAQVDGRGKSRMPGNAEAGEVEYGVGLDVSLEALAVHGCETFFFQLP